MWVRTLSGAVSVKRCLGVGKHGYCRETRENGVEEAGPGKEERLRSPCHVQIC